jgi:hypothetical protein
MRVGVSPARFGFPPAVIRKRSDFAGGTGAHPRELTRQPYSQSTLIRALGAVPEQPTDPFPHRSFMGSDENLRGLARSGG